ncbi:DUF2971 domain-containing protein [Fibrella sp. ES10-3-2-2]|nr:hypothetical protein A6C57_18645 [Fibrella sp. ES10-3-2-2]
MRLYKYRDNSDNTNKIFETKKIWLSNAEGLNDPFECTIQEIAQDYINSQVSTLMRAHVEGFLTTALRSIEKKDSNLFYGMSPKATKEFLAKFRNKTPEEQHKATREFIFRKTGREISNPRETFENFDKQLNSVGIFSMSETDNNQLMWAHYSNSSKGIALGFDSEPNFKLSNNEHCLKVTYSDTLPQFNRTGFNLEVEFYADGKNIQKIALIDETFRQAISTKPTCWEYEKEWRYIEETSGLFDFPGKLNEIIFGLKCPIPERKKYIDLIENNFDYEITINEIITINNTNQIEKIQFKK